MHMELINNTFIPEKEIPRSRRAAGRKAFLQTFRNLFTSRNHFRRFMDTYRFNTIRWSASNLHEPSWGKRIGLFFRTKNPIAILRDDYRSNRSNLLNKWETSSLNRIQMELVRMGSMPIQNKDRHTFKALNSIEKKIKQLQEYEGCPDMSHEKQLLATYKYILSSPFDGSSEDCHPMRFVGCFSRTDCLNQTFLTKITKESSRAVKQSCTNWQPERTGRNTSNRQIR